MKAYQLGLVIKLEEGIEASFKKVHDLGLPTCHVSTYEPKHYTDEVAAQVKELCQKYKIRVTTIWAGWPGRVIWDFVDGPETVGLVPLATRKERCDIVKRASDFAKLLGVDSVTTHAGFIPENPKDTLYKGLIADLQDIAAHCKKNGQWFLFETGQETAITLLRTIEDMGMDNVGINFDPANLILYGKSNPIDALHMLGKYVKGVHLKDGCYPTRGDALGEETLLGEGQVDIALFLKTLAEIGYVGALTIERETTGEQQIADVKHAIALVESLFKG